MRERHGCWLISDRADFVSAIQQLSLSPVASAERRAQCHPAMLPYRLPMPVCGPLQGSIAPDQDQHLDRQHFQKHNCAHCQSIRGNPHVLNPNAKEFIPRCGGPAAGAAVFHFYAMNAVAGSLWMAPAAGVPQPAQQVFGPTERLIRWHRHWLPPPPQALWRKPTVPPGLAARGAPRGSRSGWGAQHSKVVRPPRFANFYSGVGPNIHHQDESGPLRSVVTEWFDSEKAARSCAVKKTGTTEPIASGVDPQHCLTPAVPSNDVVHPLHHTETESCSSKADGDELTACESSPVRNPPPAIVKTSLKRDADVPSCSDVTSDSATALDAELNPRFSPKPAPSTKNRPIFIGVFGGKTSAAAEPTPPHWPTSPPTVNPPPQPPAPITPSPPSTSPAIPSVPTTAQPLKSSLRRRQRQDSRRSTTTTDESEYSTDSDSDCGSTFLPSSSVDSADDFICFLREDSSEGKQSRPDVVSAASQQVAQASRMPAAAGHDRADGADSSAGSSSSTRVVSSTGAGSSTRDGSSSEGEDSSEAEDSVDEFSESDTDVAESPFDEALWHTLSVSPMSLSYRPTLEPASRLAQCDGCQRAASHQCLTHRRIADANRTFHSEPPVVHHPNLHRSTKVRFVSGDRLATVHPAPDYDRCVGSELLDLQRQRDRQRLWRQNVQLTLAPVLTPVITEEHRARVLRQRPELLHR